jgi:peptide/nickel transport system permease protein
MVSYILRRILVSILILIAASFIMYVLAANSGDPLMDLRASNAPNADQLIGARIAALDLDVPPPLRWFIWLGGAAGCLVPFADMCDLGLTISNAQVTTILPTAMWSTIQLVSVSLVLAIVLGVIVGIVTALRQYSGFDVSMTFVSFFLYSLPSFLVAVLLKEFIAIGFNNFLQRNPTLGALAVIGIGIVVGLIWQVLIGGNIRRRLIVFAVSAASTAGLLGLLSSTGWFLQPSLGPVGLLILISAVAVGTVAVFAGLSHRRSLVVAGINGAIAYICYFALQPLFDISSLGTILILGGVAVVVGVGVGIFLGGNDRTQTMKIGGIVAVLSAALVLIDRFMQSWNPYISLPRIANRPIATVGSATPGFSGDFWVTSIDSFTHLLLPTISLLLISFAGYTRYARAGLLEVMNLDYIRTARAKGLPERTVIVRHAFRNMLIPIATLVAVDVGALLGGAVITEFVFAIPGMGQLFNASLHRVDLNPIMGYFLVIAILAITFNFLADLAYAVLDPRVRVRA